MKIISKVLQSFVLLLAVVLIPSVFSAFGWRVSLISILGNTGDRPSLALTSTNSPRVIHTLLNGANSDVIYSACDADCHDISNWSHTELGFIQLSITDKQLVITTADQPRGVFWGTGNTAVYISCDVDCDIPANWTSETIFSGSIQPAIALSSSDVPHVTFIDNPNGDLIHAVRVGGGSGSGCMDDDWSCTAIDTGGSVGNMSSLQVDSSNNPHVTYYDATNADLKYAVYVGGGSGTGCSSPDWTCITIPDPDVFVGGSSSLRLDSSDRPRVSYYSSSGLALKFASCDVSCTTPGNWIVERVHSIHFGGVNSLDLSASGVPSIVYSYDLDQDLYFAQYVGGGIGTGCTDNDWTCTLITTRYSGGSSRMFEIDSTGGFHTVFFETTADDLMYATDNTHLHIVTQSPAVGAQNVSVDANITVQFDESLNPATVTSSSVVIRGSQSGVLSGTLDVIDTSVTDDTISFVPAAHFHPNERITITITTGVQASVGADVLVLPYTYSFTVRAMAGSNTFAAPKTLPSGTFPRDIDVGDFDGDGDLDLAVVNESDATVRVFLNLGTGHFVVSADYSVASFPQGIEIADLNNDTFPDIVSTGVSNISVLINNGDGTFANAVHYPASGSAWKIVAADFDGDGYSDLAVSNRNDNNFSVYLNNGDGTFAPRFNIATGNAPRGISSADVDNDGDMDIVVTNTDFTNTVTVHYNDGTGLFPFSSTHATAASPHHLTVADIHDDGFVDLLVSAVSPNRVSVLRNMKNGLFFSKVDVVSGVDPQAIVAADFDNDGDLDLAVTNSGTDAISILVNDGFGSFTSSVIGTVGDLPFGLASGDFDGDGSIDLASANFNDGTVSILLQDYTPPQVSIVQPNGGETMIAGMPYDIIWSATDASGVTGVDLEYTVNDLDYNPIPGAAGLTSGTSYPFVRQWTPGFTHPYAIDQDSFGNLYTSGLGNTVQKTDSEGNVLQQWTGVGEGRGLAIDSQDMVYVSDGISLVKKYDTSGNLLDSFGGGPGSADGQLQNPYGVSVDSADNVYVSERNNHRISKFDSLGTFLGCLGGGVGGFQNPCNSFAAGSGNGFLSQPWDLVVTDSAIYVSEVGNDRVSKFDVGGNFISNWSSGSDPTGIDVDAMGNVYVSSLDNARFRKYDSDGNLLLERNTGLFLNGMFLDDYGNVYVTSLDQHVVEKYASGGSFTWTVPASVTNQAKIRAIATDGAGNTAQDDSDAVFDIVVNTAPTATVPTSITHSTDGSGHMTFDTTIEDGDLDLTRLQVQYSDNGGTNFYDAELVSVTPDSGTVDLDNSSTYQIGSVNAIDTDGGSVTLTIVWDTQSSSNGNGPVTGHQHDIQLRVIPNDFVVDGTAQTTSDFSVDNQVPVGLAALNEGVVSATEVELLWSAVTEANFSHYEIWYGEVQVDVVNRTGAAVEWDDSDDGALALLATTSTTITGLDASTSYYFKIFAVDVFGNVETVMEILLDTSGAGGGRRRMEIIGIQGSVFEPSVLLEDATVGGGEGAMTSTVGGGVESFHDSADDQTKLTSLNTLRALQQLFGWLDTDDYQLLTMKHRLKRQYNEYFRLKQTISYLGNILGFGNGYEYREPGRPDIENVAELMKALMIKFSGCFTSEEMERAISHDNPENGWWWAGYWHFLDPFMKSFLEEEYLLWDSIDQLNILEVLQNFLVDHCGKVR